MEINKGIERNAALVCMFYWQERDTGLVIPCQLDGRSYRNRTLLLTMNIKLNDKIISCEYFMFYCAYT